MKEEANPLQTLDSKFRKILSKNNNKWQQLGVQEKLRGMEFESATQLYVHTFGEVFSPYLFPCSPTDGVARI